MSNHEREKMIPLTILGVAALMVSAGLFAVTYAIESESFQSYLLGASTAIWLVVCMQFLVAKYLVWPGALVFRRTRAANAD